MSAYHSPAMAAEARRHSSMLHLLNTPIKNSGHSVFLGRHDHRSMALYFSLLQPSTMPPKGKGKKGNGAAPGVTPKQRSKWAACKSQPLPVYLPAIVEDLSDFDRTFGSQVETVDLGMSGVMDLLLDISSRLQATEHFMEEVKSVSVEWKQKSTSCSQLAMGMSRGRCHSSKQGADVCFWFPFTCYSHAG